MSITTALLFGEMALFSPPLYAFLLALSLWEIAWKGIGLWRAARNSHIR